MKKFSILIFLLCGLGFALAALPVFAQDGSGKSNRQPLKDFTEFVRNKVALNEIDLNAPFSIELDGVLDKDGKLDTAKSKIVRANGDEKMVAVAKQGLAAISDSGYLAYLSRLGAKKVNIVVSQDEQTLSVVIKSDAETDAKAKTTVSGLSMMMQLAKLQSKDEGEKLVLDNTSVTARGKEFIINFALPKAVAQERIKQKWQETKSAADLSNRR